MATRVISTSIKLDGEAEFKKRLSSINSELKTSQSELAYVTEAFKGQANTLEALTAKGDVLEKQLAATNEKIEESETYLSKAKEAQANFAKAIEDAKSSAEKQGVSLEKLYGDTKKLTEEEKEIADALAKAEQGYEKVTKSIQTTTQTLNRAKTDEIALSREIKENNRYLDEARQSADKTAKSIDGFGKEVKDADKRVDDFGKELSDADSDLDDFGQSAKDAAGNSGKFGGALKNLAGDLGKFKALAVGGAAVTALKKTADAIHQIVDETAEYRRVMGVLDSSSQAAGYTAEETAEAYTRLYGVLADNQSSATTVANLQAIGLEQEDLMELVDLTTGAWAKYGDSIPIDSLAESINETIQAGEVTGTFADVLNWTAGITEDEFNEALSNCKTATERADLVMQTMAEQGLAEIAEGYRTAESETIKANEAQAKYEEAQANLAEKLLPAKTALTNLATTGWDVLSSSIQGAIDLFNDAMELFNGKEKHLEAYTAENGQTRYRLVEDQAASVTQGLTGAELRDRGVTSADVYNAAAAVANSNSDIWSRGSRGSMEMVHTTINIDGRAVAEATAPALREVNKSNPEVVSDKL